MAFGLDVGSIYAHVKADVTHFVGGMSVVNTSLKKTAAQAAALSAQLIKTGALIGGAVAVASGKAFASFDDAMTRSTAIMGNLSDETKRAMKDMAIELAGNGVQSATELVESYYFLASAGFDAEASIKALPKVQQFATAGAFDMSRATDLLTDSQSALGLVVDDTSKTIDNMVRLSDLYVRANTLSNASVEQFAEAMAGDAGPVMRQYNIEIEDGLAVLAAYATQSKKAGESSNLFGRAVRLTMKAMRTNRKEWDRLGLDIYNANRELRPFADIVSDLSEYLNELSTEQRGAAMETLGFAALTQKAIVPLLGMGSSIRMWRDELVKTGSVTKDVSDKQLKSFGNQLRIAWNNIKNIGIILGEVVSQIGPGLQTFFQNMENWFVDNQNRIASWATSIINSFKDVVSFFKKIQADIGMTLTLKNIGTEANKRAVEEYQRTYGDAGWTKVLDPAKTNPMFGQMGMKNVRTYQEEFEKMVKYYRRVLTEETGVLEDNWWENQLNKVKEIQAKQITEIDMPDVTIDTEFDTSGLERSAGELKAIAALTAEQIDQGMAEMYNGLNDSSQLYWDKQLEYLEANVKRWRANIDQIMDAYDLERSAVEDLIDAYEEEQRILQEIDRLKKGKSVAGGFETYILEVQNQQDRWGERAYNTAQDMENAFADGLENIATDFDNLGDHIKQIMSEIHMAILRNLVINPIAEQMSSMIFKGIGAVVSSFGTAGASASGEMTSMDIDNPAIDSIQYHGGGIIGKEGTSRVVSASVFANAQKAHTGLRPKERAIIAKDNEGVFTPEQMNALGKTSMGGDKVNGLLRELITKVQLMSKRPNIIQDRRPDVAETLKQAQLRKNQLGRVLMGGRR